jgi:hypothetical protein
MIESNSVNRRSNLRPIYRWKFYSLMLTAENWQLNSSTFGLLIQI